MTRTYPRHALSVVAALALVSAFVSSPVSAQTIDQWFTNQIIQETEAKKKPKTPKSLAMKQKPPAKQGMIREGLGAILVSPTFDPE